MGMVMLNRNMWQVRILFHKLYSKPGGKIIGVQIAHHKPWSKPEEPAVALISLLVECQCFQVLQIAGIWTHKCQVFFAHAK